MEGYTVAVLAVQVFIVFSIIIARFVSKKHLFGVCVLWTLFTFLAVFATPLVLLQLATIWGTYSVLAEKVQQPSGRGDAPRDLPDPKPAQAKEAERDGAPKTAPNPGGGTSALFPGVGKLVDELSGSVNRTRKVQEATADLLLSVYREQIFIDNILEVAQRKVDLEKWKSENEGRAKIFEEEYQRYSKILDENNDGSSEKKYSASLEVLLGPCFDFPQRNSDNLIADAIESRIERAREERSNRLAELIKKLRADEVLRDQFAKELERCGASAIWDTIRRMANDFKSKDRARLRASPPTLSTTTEVPTVRDSASLEGALVRREHLSSLVSTPLASDWLAPSGKEAVSEEMKDRKIPYFVHFTRVENLASILTHGLCPVASLRSKELPYSFNDRHRLEGRLDATSLSIAHPNEKMFYKYRMNEPAQEWAVLIIEPNLWASRLGSCNAAFCRHNAADSRVTGIPLAKRMTAQAFSNMFAPCKDLPSREAQGLECYDPTDVQAEVLLFGEVPPRRIKGAVFMSHATCDRFRGLFGTRNLEVQADGTGLFGARARARNNQNAAGENVSMHASIPSNSGPKL
jgi:hypothetical protein